MTFAEGVGDVTDAGGMSGKREGRGIVDVPSSRRRTRHSQGVS